MRILIHLYPIFFPRLRPLIAVKFVLNIEVRRQIGPHRPATGCPVRGFETSMSLKEDIPHVTCIIVFQPLIARI
jgi:hypothetical protein